MKSSDKKPTKRERIVIQLNYNWFIDPIKGEQFSNYKIGERVLSLSKTSTATVTEIHEHMPEFEGDICYYDVYFDFRDPERIFNPNKVIYGYSYSQ